MILPTFVAVVQEAAVGGSSALVVGSAVAVALGLVEALKAAISKISGSQSSAERGTIYNHSDRTLLRDLHNWHAPEAGRQEWKNPETRELLGDILAELVKLNARSQAERDSS